MDETFDPDDQFFQAFKAGYELASPIRVSDEYLWEEYLTWLKDES